MGRIIAICISENRGTPKREIAAASLETDWGIRSDAHAGKWHRQISLLPYEEIEKFRRKGAEVSYGAFGENLVVEGFDLKRLPIGSRLQSGEVILEITQIGKECHNHCAIYKKMGECIMPGEGVFAKVIHGGRIQTGDRLELITNVNRSECGEADLHESVEEA